MTPDDLLAIWITAKLAFVTTLVLCLIGTPLAWWLSRSQHWSKPAVEAIVTLPLVLPPTVLGFYLLILLNPNTLIGSFIVEVTGVTLTFSFAGLVVASIIYSLPFMVQPLQVAFESVGKESLETSASLGVGPSRAFFSVVIPQCLRGFLSATVLTFTHTIGEFGVVLMVGGNIPGETKVISIAIYEHVETIAYTNAHYLSATLLIFAFSCLVIVYAINRKIPIRGY